jgi:hypothetical protein
MTLVTHAFPEFTAELIPLPAGRTNDMVYAAGGSRLFLVTFLRGTVDPFEPWSTSLKNWFDTILISRGFNPEFSSYAPSVRHYDYNQWCTLTRRATAAGHLGLQECYSGCDAGNCAVQHAADFGYLSDGDKPWYSS